MSGYDVRSTSVPQTLGDLQRRVQILEAVVPSGGDTWVNYEIKLFSDSDPALVVDGAFFFPIPEDLNGLHLVAGAAGVSTPGGSGTMTVQVQNQGTPASPLTDDMFSTEITIDAGDSTSYDATTPPVVDTGVDQVFTGQTLRVDVDTIPASDGLGLALILSFDSVPGGTGAIGPPGPTGATGATGSGNMATDSIWDTKGDIAVATGADAAVAVPVGTDGQVLVADSGETSGVKWDNPASSLIDYAQVTSNLTVTATTSATAQAYVTGASVSYDGSTQILIDAYVPAATAAQFVDLILYDGSTELGVIIDSGLLSTSLSITLRGGMVLTPSAGSHTYSIRAYRGTGSATVYAGNGTAGNYMPGYILITRL